MEDKIRIESESMREIGRLAYELASELKESASAIRRIKIDEESGADVRVNISLRLKSGGKTKYASNVEDAIGVCALQLAELRDAVLNLRVGINSALLLFEENEKKICLMSLFDENVSLQNYSRSFGEVFWEIGGRQAYISNHTKEWEANVEFIQTQYNEEILRRMRELFENDKRLSPAAWEACKTYEQKKAYILAAVNAAAEIMQVDLTGGAHCVESNILNLRVEGEDGTHGLPANVVGQYDPSDDSITIRVTPLTGYENIIGTIFHEMRHNMQNEVILDAGNGRHDKYTINEGDYDDYYQSAQDWYQEMYVEYRTPSNAQQVAEKKREIESQLAFYELSDRINAGTIAYEEVEREYLAQEVETDARYMENMAIEMGKQRKKTENEARAAVIREFYRSYPIFVRPPDELFYNNNYGNAPIA